MINAHGTTTRGERQTVDIDRLCPNPWNPNVQTGFISERLSNSLEVHGFIKEVLVREVGPNKPEGRGKTLKPGLQIIDGEHRWTESKAKGMRVIEIRNLGEVEDYEAMMLTVTLNETTGQSDAVKLGLLLQELIEEPFMPELPTLPFTNDEIDLSIRIATAHIKEEQEGQALEKITTKKKESKWLFQVGRFRGDIEETLAKRADKVIDAIKEKIKTDDFVSVLLFISQSLQEDFEKSGIENFVEQSLRPQISTE